MKNIPAFGPNKTETHHLWSPCPSYSNSSPLRSLTLPFVLNVDMPDAVRSWSARGMMCQRELRRVVEGGNAHFVKGQTSGSNKVERCCWTRKRAQVTRMRMSQESASKCWVKLNRTSQMRVAAASRTAPWFASHVDLTQTLSIIFVMARTCSCMDDGSRIKVSAPPWMPGMDSAAPRREAKQRWQQGAQRCCWQGRHRKGRPLRTCRHLGWFVRDCCRAGKDGKPAVCRPADLGPDCWARIRHVSAQQKAWPQSPCRDAHHQSSGWSGPRAVADAQLPSHMARLLPSHLHQDQALLSQMSPSTQQSRLPVHGTTLPPPYTTSGRSSFLPGPRSGLTSQRQPKRRGPDVSWLP